MVFNCGYNVSYCAMYLTWNEKLIFISMCIVLCSKISAKLYLCMYVYIKLPKGKRDCKFVFALHSPVFFIPVNQTCWKVILHFMWWKISSVFVFLRLLCPSYQMYHRGSGCRIIKGHSNNNNYYCYYHHHWTWISIIYYYLWTWISTADVFTCSTMT